MTQLSGRPCKDLPSYWVLQNSLSALDCPPQTPIRPKVLYHMPVLLRPLQRIAHPLKHVRPNIIAPAFSRHDTRRNRLIIRRCFPERVDNGQLQLIAPE